MPRTKVCPGCKQNVAADAITCSCGHDFLADDCPGCDQPISLDAEKCPHCGYNLVASAPPPKTTKPKEPKEPKPAKVGPGQRTKVKEEVKEEGNKSRVPSGYRGTIWVPALGRYGLPPLEFPELHFKGDPEDDEALKEWAENLRYAWANHDQGAYLSNHAVMCLAGHEENLKGKSRHILKLLGGDDWK